MILLLLTACTGKSADDTAVAPIVDTSDPEADNFPYDNAIHAFGLELDDAALAALAADPYTDVHGTFTFQGESYDVGVHLKGNYSFQDMSGKPSFKVDFHEWVPDQRFHDIERFALNNMVQDSSMSSEHASYRLYDTLGLITPQHGYAQVSVNGELYGLYGIVEAIDEHFINHHFDDDTGNLYEGGYGGDVAEGCDDKFELKEAGEPADLSDMVTLIDSFLATTPDTFFAYLSANFVVDPLLDLWAGELVASNADAYTTLGNNFYLYHEPTTGLWTMIPTGADQAFIDNVDVHEEHHGNLALACVESAECNARLDARLTNVVSVWTSSDLPGWVATETAKIEDACRTDPRSPWGDYGCRDAQIAIRDWTTARPGVVQGQM